MNYNDFLKHYHGHFFDKDTMRFFNSRILDWDSKTGYFITSERMSGQSRRYTIRKANFHTFDIESYSLFGEYDKIGAVKNRFKKLVSTV